MKKIGLIGQIPKTKNKIAPIKKGIGNDYKNIERIPCGANNFTMEE